MLRTLFYLHDDRRSLSAVSHAEPGTLSRHASPQPAHMYVWEFGGAPHDWGHCPRPHDHVRSAQLASLEKALALAG